MREHRVPLRLPWRGLASFRVRQLILEVVLDGVAGRFHQLLVLVLDAVVRRRVVGRLLVGRLTLDDRETGIRF